MMSQATTVRARFRALPFVCTLDQVRLERGTFSDYRALAQFHYKSARPGAAVLVWRLVHEAPTVVGRYVQRRAESRIIGVLVRSLPQLSCQLRNLATGQRYSALKPRDAAVMLNREVRTISRVVIDPQWRGLGLAVKLVQHALQHPESDVRYTEALAAMGRVSPFFERAGMIRYERPPRPEQARLMEALRHVGLQPHALASINTTLAQLTDASINAFLLAELRRWQRAAQRTSTAQLDQMSLRDLLSAARDELFTQPVYYLFQHETNCVNGKEGLS